MNPYGQVYYHPAYPVTYGYDFYGNPVVYAVGPPQMPPPPVPTPSPAPSTSSSQSSGSATIVALPGEPKEAPQQYFAKVCRLVHLVEQWQDANKNGVPDWQFPDYLVDPVAKEWMPVEEAFQRFGEHFSEEEKATWSILGAQRARFLEVVDDVLERLKGEREIAIQMMRGNLLD
ncbi:hypothetical protein ARMSODRAFT_1047025 [Armillaria solidipes]|uniref:Uncharacterized protein n=1 Tax=Armillaria solidipes TaxID=1076256 RepID=A0A2H3BQ75_9AGAR|nr:hypothetical protein ARMSODRAFT_1047025 [Armillaria solidipes]